MSAADILIVDDEPDILDLLGYNLEQEGFEVRTATDGMEALEMAKKDIPDLVILDADPDEPEPGGGLLDRFGGPISSALSLVGLALAAVGGLVMLYGGLVGAQSRTPTGSFPPEVRLLIFAGFLVLAVGGGLILYTTRQRNPIDDGPG